MYANLAKLNLPYAEAVFTLSYFKENPVPFYKLAHELYPGQYRPTISHAFIRLLSKKGLLLKLFTQNIDCLEREAGIPEDKIVEAHGSFATHSCIECKTTYPENSMRQAIETQEVPHCQVPQCNGLVKPDIVFFGEGLPSKFFDHHLLPQTADLCIVMGTSLTVQPFASLPGFCSRETPRLLINMERVGDLGSRLDDVLLLEDCDTGVRRLATAMAWQDELEALWASIKPELAKPNVTENGPETAEESLESKVDALTAQIDASLKVSDAHVNDVKSYLSESSISSKAAHDARPLDLHSGQDQKPQDLASSAEAAIGTAAVSTKPLHTGNMMEASKAPSKVLKVEEAGSTGGKEETSPARLSDTPSS